MATNDKTLYGPGGAGAGELPVGASGGNGRPSGPKEASEERELLELEKWKAALEFCRLHFVWFVALDPVRRNVVREMALDLGPALLGYRDMLEAMARGDYFEAAACMVWNTRERPTKWYLANPDRARKLADEMHWGEPWHPRMR